MDTLTHTATGAAIATAAVAIDPSIASNHTSLILLIIVCILTANGPDIDTLLKKHRKFLAIHRGFTHGVFSMLLITTILGLCFAFPTASHIGVLPYIGILLACGFSHIIMDITNHYGTQILWPVSHKWVAYSFISTFDPYILLTQTVYIICFWAWRDSPVVNEIMWTIGFLSILSTYYLIRFIFNRIIVHKIKTKYPEYIKITMVTMIGWSRYRYVVRTLDHIYVGKSKTFKLYEQDTSLAAEPIRPDVLRLLNKNDEYNSFRYFSPVFKVRMNTISETRFTVHLTDLRYFTAKQHYPLQVRLFVDIEQNRVELMHNGYQYKPKKVEDHIRRG